MASYHLTAKIGIKGKAAPHAAYISRTDKYSEGKRYEDMEATGYGNMPAWAIHNPAYFWQEADQHERANGSTYREIEIALPRELTKDQRLELVQDFINQEIGNKHAYQFAIHNPKATIDKGEQPHAHIMYSERIRDGIERNPEQYFKRYNAKNREKGGAKKHSGGKRADELKAELLVTRERWASIQNQHLKKHGHSDRVTHLSLGEQGINRAPEKHIGTHAYKMNSNEKAALMEHRLNAQELDNATKQLAGLDLAKAICIEKCMNEQEEKAALMLEAKRTALEYRLKQEQERQAEREQIERISREEVIEQSEPKIVFGSAIDELLKKWESRKNGSASEQKEHLLEPDRRIPPDVAAQKHDQPKQTETDEQKAERAEKLIASYTEQARNQWRTDETNKIKAEAQKLRDDAQKLLANEPQKPKLFGRAEWERNHAELDSKVSYANWKARDMEKGIESWLRTGGQIHLFRHEGMQRLKEEDPELYKTWQDVRKKRQVEEEQRKQLQKQAQKSKQKGKDRDLER